jgi:branched-chain amino acid aminotransferase
LNGRLVDETEASISPFDHGILVGDGVFETLRVYAGQPFAVRRHLDRLERSAAGIELPVPPRPVLEQAVGEVAAASGVDEGRLRVTITSGVGPLGSARGEAGLTVVAAVTPFVPLPADYAVRVAPWARNERGALTGLKTISYAENARALAWARRHGADEAIFANLAGNLCEGSATNVFLVAGGRLMTPPLSAGCLAGVTRDLVIELTDAAEEDMPVDALAVAEEAFVTGTVAEVRPIASVDGVALPECPGPLTAAAADAFRALVRRAADP